MDLGNITVDLGLRTMGFNTGLQGAASALTKFGATAQSIGRGMQTLGRKMQMFVTLPAIIAGGLSLRAFGKFEKNMRNVNTIARQNEEQFEATSRAVIAMGNELGKGPTELADALYNINSASFVANEGLKVLEVSTKAAIAGVSTTAESAKVITAVLNAYGKSADEAGDVADTLFKTVEKGVTTFPELAEAMGSVISTAAAAKVDFGELSAALATMTRGGLNSARSATALNTFLLKLTKPTEELAKLFKEQANTTGAAMLETEGLAGVMRFLTKHTGGSIEAIGKLGFGFRDIKAVLSLGRNNMKDFAGDLDVIAVKSARAGAMMAAFVEQNKSFARQMERFKTLLESVGISIGRTIAPAFAGFIAIISSLLKWFDSQDQAVQSFIIGMVALAAAVGPVLVAVGGLVSLVGFVAAGIPAIAGVAGALVPLIPLILTIVGIAASFWALMINLIGSGDTFGERFGDTLGKVGQLFIWLAKTGVAAGIEVAFAIEKILHDVDVWTDNTIIGFMNMWTTIKSIFTFISDNWSNLLSLMGLMFSNFLSAFVVSLKNLPGIIAKVISGTLSESDITGLGAKFAKSAGLTPEQIAEFGQPFEEFKSPDLIEKRDRISEQSDIELRRRQARAGADNAFKSLEDGLAGLSGLLDGIPGSKDKQPEFRIEGDGLTTKIIGLDPDIIGHNIMDGVTKTFGGQAFEFAEAPPDQETINKSAAAVEAGTMEAYRLTNNLPDPNKRTAKKTEKNTEVTAHWIQEIARKGLKVTNLKQGVID